MDNNVINFPNSYNDDNTPLGTDMDGNELHPGNDDSLENTSSEEINNEENNNKETDDNAESSDIDSFIANIKTSVGVEKVSIKQDTRTEAPNRPKKRFSRIGMRFPTLRGALDNINSDNYFDVVDKINKGIISIKCN